MKKLSILALAASVSACAGSPHIDLCKHADLRRAGYTSIIATADAWVASGRPVPAEVLVGRQAAVTALVVLDRNCPAATP